MKALVGIEQNSFPVIKEVLPCRKIAHIKFSHIQACLVNRLCRAVVFNKFFQRITPNSPEQIVCFHPGIWTPTQLNYSTIKKEILSIVLCISKFQSDLLNQKFLIRIDCKSSKHVLEKDVQNIASKQIFA